MATIPMTIIAYLVLGFMVFVTHQCPPRLWAGDLNKEGLHGVETGMTKEEFTAKWGISDPSLGGDKEREQFGKDLDALIESNRGVFPAPKLKWTQQTDNSDKLCDDWTAEFMGYYFTISELKNGYWRVEIVGDPRSPCMAKSSEAGKKICQDWFRDQWQKEMGVPAADMVKIGDDAIIKNLSERLEFANKRLEGMQDKIEEFEAPSEPELLASAYDALVSVKGQMPYHDGEFTEGEAQSMLKCDAAIELLKQYRQRRGIETTENNSLGVKLP